MYKNMTYRFSVAEQQRIYGIYCETKSAVETAKRLGLSRRRVTKELKAIGVELNYRGNRVNHDIKIKHGYRKHPLYNIWGTMKQRCYNPNNKMYKFYGGMGIGVCEEWREKSGR